MRRWLTSRGFSTGFFFPDAKDGAPAYLDPGQPRYSRNLAAAVRAWIAYNEIPGKSPKHVLDKWLREHASEYGMTNEDGNPVEAAIDRCATVANWQTVGGAPKTPGANLPTP